MTPARLACALLVAALPAAAAPGHEDQAFSLAMADRTRGPALAALAPLADAGHRQAAREALRLVQREPGSIGLGRQAHWQTVASGAALDRDWKPGPHGC